MLITVDYDTSEILTTLICVILIGLYAATKEWFDQLGTKIISLLIFHLSWTLVVGGRTRRRRFLVDHRVLQRITLLAWRISPLVEGYKSIEAYHVGDRVWVEVVIALDGNATTSYSQDVVELMKCLIQSLPEVERVFISCSI